MVLYPFERLASRATVVEGFRRWRDTAAKNEKTRLGGMHYLPNRTDQVGLHDAGASSPRPQELLSLDRCETVEASLLLVKSTTERP